MGTLPGFLLGPLLYMALLSAAGVMLAPVPTSTGGTVAAGALGSVLAVLALARSVRAPLGMALAARLGLAALLAALFLGAPGDSSRALAPIHAALLLVAAAALGESFAEVVEPRLRDPSVLVTAGVCLALFDGWSVAFGPASNAVSGGFLQRLLLEIPAPGGVQRFVGISDLVIIALLAGLARRCGWGVRRALLAGLAGLELALAQALITRHAAPALPAIGLAFCAANWPQVRPTGLGWQRTARWAVGSAAALAGVTLVLRLVRPGA